MKDEKSTIKRLKILPVLFRKQDVEKLTPYAGTFLYRAVQQGLIHRLNRGNYVNSFLYGFAPVEQVGCFLRPPAYVSCEWALNYHGISLQVPTVCTVVTLSTSVGRGRAVRYQGVEIEFSTISPSLFFGFAFHDGFYVAIPEKAILDTLYYRKTIPAWDDLELDRVDVDLLRKMAGKFPASLRHLLNLNELEKTNFIGRG